MDNSAIFAHKKGQCRNTPCLGCLPKISLNQLRSGEWAMVPSKRIALSSPDSPQLDLSGASKGEVSDAKGRRGGWSPKMLEAWSWIVSSQKRSTHLWGALATIIPKLRLSERSRLDQSRKWKKKSSFQTVLSASMIGGQRIKSADIFPLRRGGRNAYSFSYVVFPQRTTTRMYCPNVVFPAPNSTQDEQPLRWLPPNARGRHFAEHTSRITPFPGCRHPPKRTTLLSGFLQLPSICGLLPLPRNRAFWHIIRSKHPSGAWAATNTSGQRCRGKWTALAGPQGPRPPA